MTPDKMYIIRVFHVISSVFFGIGPRMDEFTNYFGAPDENTRDWCFLGISGFWGRVNQKDGIFTVTCDPDEQTADHGKMLQEANAKQGQPGKPGW